MITGVVVIGIAESVIEVIGEVAMGMEMAVNGWAAGIDTVDATTVGAFAGQKNARLLHIRAIAWEEKTVADLPITEQCTYEHGEGMENATRYRTQPNFKSPSNTLM